MRCPKCGTENVQFATSTHSHGPSFLNGCCGVIMLGPLGALCGLCGMGSETREFWVCKDCGAKFQATDAKEAEQQRIKIKAEVENAIKKREQLIHSVSVNVRENIDTEITKAEQIKAEATEKFNSKKKDAFRQDPHLHLEYIMNCIFRTFVLLIPVGISYLICESILLTIVGSAFILPAVWAMAFMNSESPRYKKHFPPDTKEAYQEMKTAEAEYKHLKDVKEAIEKQNP